MFTEGQIDSGDKTCMRKMLGLIPAAGSGSRMGTLVSHSHKGLLEINGQSALEHAVGMLRSAGIEEIHVVTGHQAQLVEHRLGDTVICCFNPFFRVAGILGSFWQVMPMFDGRPFVFTFSDHFFRPSLLLRCLSLDADLVILIQKKAAYTREDSKALIEGESVRFGKDIPLHEANGEYTGLTVLSARGSAAFFDQMRRLLKDGRLDAYAMDVLNAVTDRSDISVSLVYCDESSRIEIDTVADLRRARQMAGHILKERG